MAKTVEFFFDYGSPYSYIADTQIEGIKKRTGATIEYRPFLLGGAFKATENQSPAFETCKPKAAYGGLVMQRWVAKHGIKFQRNPFFPINTLPLMRACTAAKMDGVFEAFHAAVFPAFWAEGKNMGDPEVIGEVLTKGGVDAEKLMARTQDQEVKDALIAATEEAVKRGTFGAPTFFVGDEMFFGQDHIPFLEDYLNS